MNLSYVSPLHLITFDSKLVVNLQRIQWTKNQERNQIIFCSFLIIVIFEKTLVSKLILQKYIEIYYFKSKRGKKIMIYENLNKVQVLILKFHNRSLLNILREIFWYGSYFLLNKFIFYSGSEFYWGGLKFVTSKSGKTLKINFKKHTLLKKF